MYADHHGTTAALYQKEHNILTSKYKPLEHMPLELGQEWLGNIISAVVVTQYEY